VASLQSLIRRPAVHFVLLGLVLYGIARWWTVQDDAGDPRGASIVIERERVERLRDEFRRQTGSPPTPEQERALVGEEVDEEILYREALARGLENGDRSVRWWLIKKMRFVAEDPAESDDDLYRKARELGLDRDDIVIRRILAQKMRLLAEVSGGSVEPDEAEVEAYYEKHRGDWMRPERVSLSHVFLSRDRRGAATEEDAKTLLAEIEGRPPPEVGDVGDPFALGRRHTARSQEQLAKLFGPEFAERVSTLEPGHWVGPIPSAYGLHLVWVEEKLAAEPASLGSVRNQVSRRLAAERREAALSQELEKLRPRYDVRVEPATSSEGAADAS